MRPSIYTIVPFLAIQRINLENTLKMTPKMYFDDHMSLKEFDSELFDLIKLEENRIKKSIDLIASENLVSTAVLDCLGSCLTFKYSEGSVGNRFYSGCGVVDKIEQLCKDRALKAFGLDPSVWGVNVQALSGSPANIGTLIGVLDLHDKIMGMSMFSGGHLTHGYYLGHKSVSASSKMFSSLSYGLDPKTGLIDYENMDFMAKTFYPKLIIAGASSYSRFIDYKKFRETCDSVGAYLMADMSHIAGLVAAGLHPSPFEYADIVTTTTHKTLKGPRGALIFYNKQRHEELENKIDSGIFPMMQGGPHNNAIAAIATQLKQVMSPEWKEYAGMIIKCSKIFASELEKRGFEILTGGTDNHTVIINLRPLGITGSKAQVICDAVNITCNKATMPGDKSPQNPSGIRLGTAPMVSRGCKEEDFVAIAEFFKESIELAKELQNVHGKMLKDFNVGVERSEKVKELSKRVEEWALRFPSPGI